MPEGSRLPILLGEPVRAPLLTLCADTSQQLRLDIERVFLFLFALVFFDGAPGALPGALLALLGHENSVR